MWKDGHRYVRTANIKVSVTFIGSSDSNSSVFFMHMNKGAMLLHGNIYSLQQKILVEWYVYLSFQVVVIGFWTILVTAGETALRTVDGEMPGWLGHVFVSELWYNALLLPQKVDLFLLALKNFSVWTPPDLC